MDAGGLLTAIQMLVWQQVEICSDMPVTYQ